MTFTVPDGTETTIQPTSVIKLRLNLSGDKKVVESNKGLSNTTVSDSSQGRRSPSKNQSRDSNHEDERPKSQTLSKVKAKARRVDTKESDENRDINIEKPLRLTVRLKAAAAPPEEEKRKIVLSVKSNKTDERVDIETVDRPPKKARTTSAPKAKKVSSDDGTANLGGHPKRPSHTKEKGSTQSPFSSIPAVSKPIISTATSTTKMPIPNFRPSNMTRVPIAAMSSLTTMTPGEREEERQMRQAISETFGTLWPMITKPTPEVSFESWDAIHDRLIPYWLMLSPVDSAYNVPSLKSTVTETDAVGKIVDKAADKRAKIADEIAKLCTRYRQVTLKEKNKEIATELLVLEQRLCLEEEKFLYAKLKSEYNKKVGELLARKRQSSELASSTLGALAPHQRILPKTGTSWAAGSGIQILRGGSTDATNT